MFLWSGNQLRNAKFSRKDKLLHSIRKQSPRLRPEYVNHLTGGVVMRTGGARRRKPNCGGGGFGRDPPQSPIVASKRFIITQPIHHQATQLATQSLYFLGSPPTPNIDAIYHCLEPSSPLSPPCIWKNCNHPSVSVSAPNRLHSAATVLRIHFDEHIRIMINR